MPPHPAARTSGQLLAFLKRISGKQTVAGIHNDLKTGGPAHHSDKLRSITGKSPALWGGDFLFDARMESRWDMIHEAERQWRAGAVVNLMWHASPPNQGPCCEWKGGILSHLSDAEWSDLITDGGKLNRIWKDRMDGIAPYLRHLADHEVEVLWRPLHEMNQAEFWWGGRPGKEGTARLFQITHDYLVGEKGLDNLVWTWDIQDLRFDWDAYHPGDAYFDVMALDMYSMGYTDSLYEAMIRIAGSKVIGLGEVAAMPTPEQLARQPRYAFAMGWADLVFEKNTNRHLTALFHAPNVLNLEDMPGWQSADHPGGNSAGYMDITGL